MECRITAVGCACLSKKFSLQIKANLIDFTGGHLARGDLILWADHTDQERRIWVVLAALAGHRLFAVIGIAIPAAVAAGIVGADIQGFDTAAL